MVAEALHPGSRRRGWGGTSTRVTARWRSDPWWRDGVLWAEALGGGAVAWWRAGGGGVKRVPWRSGRARSGSWGGGPGRRRRVKLGLSTAAWRGAVHIHGRSASAISWFCHGLVSIRAGDERAGSISAALAIWRGGVGVLLPGSSGGAFRQCPVCQGSYGGTAVAVGRRI